MTIFEAFVLGVLQGVAEFLPISSSAHLYLARWIFGWPEPGLGFDVALHVGTLAALLWYFRVQWLALGRAAVDIVRYRRIESDMERRVPLLIIATIPAGLAGLLLEDLAETVFRAPALSATMLIVVGLLLWAVDRWMPAKRSLPGMGWRDALLIGIAQIAALVPGVSRSGATITAGRSLGLTRETAAVFSFLMSMPIIAAASLLKVPQAVGEMGLSAALVVGVIAAGASSWIAIAFLLRFVSTRSFGAFAVYRIIFGIFIFVLLYVRGSA